MTLPDGKWVRLGGDRLDVDAVVGAFDDPPRVTFAQADDDGVWWMKAELFNPVDDAAEICSVATDLIGSINGCAQLLWGDHIPVLIDDAVDFRDSGGRNNQRVVLGRPAVSRSRVQISTVAEGGQPAGPPPRIAWLRLGLADPDIGSVLRLVGKPEPTWSELYHLLELVEDSAGQSVDKAGWTTPGERRLFKHTADNRYAVGEQARHGRRNRQPPANPMSINEARRIARKIAEDFLNSKTPRDASSSASIAEAARPSLR